jgi:two-component system sensor histidine kinase/response regulator
MKTTETNSTKKRSAMKRNKTAHPIEGAKRKKEEITPMEEQTLLRTLMDNLLDSIYFKDVESRFIRINQTQARRFGLDDPAGAVGKTDFDFFSKEHSQPAYEDEQEIIRSGKPLVGKEEKETWPDGRVGWVSTTKMPLRNQEGKIIGTFGISRDITERKQAEDAVLREKQYFEALVRNSPVAVAVLDSQGKIISVNPAFEQLFGYRSDEVIGAKLDTLVTTPETEEEAKSHTRNALVGPIRATSKRRRKDGSLFDVDIFGAPVVVNNEHLGIIAIYHDISEIMNARQDAEQANRAKSEFLANMSHEIRTPMNGVIGMLELALDTTLTPEQTDYLQAALQSAESLLALLNDILDFSKIESGRLELENIDFSLRNTVEDVAYTLASRAQDKGLEMACLIHPDLTSDLKGDPGRIRQILVNLVGNAIKFTHQGEIVIRAEPTE